jgi:hypothetical protein
MLDKKFHMKIIAGILVFSLMLFSACSSDQTSANENETVASKTSERFKGQFEIDAKVEAIDANEQLKKLNSLSFTNNAKSSAEAIAYLDDNDREVKIIEKFNSTETGNYGSKTFYIENGAVFCAKEVYFDKQISVPSFVERISYYGKKQQVLVTIERFAAYEEDLDQTEFNVTAKKRISVDRALSILNHSGEFETTFQGFLTHNNMDFILVGKNTADGFTSALSIQSQNATVLYLQKNERKMVGTLLDVSHSFILDGSGMTFQVLNEITIIQPKK